MSGPVSRSIPGQRRWVFGVAGVVLALGAIVAKSVTISVGLLAGAAIVASTFVAPATNLVLIVLTTAIVPFTFQNRLGGGGRGLIPSDVLLLAGLLRVVPGILAGAPINRRQRMLLLGLTTFSVLAVLNFVRGLAAGHDPSGTGAELRILLDFTAFVVAVPLLNDPRTRGQVLKGLLFVGLALGLWGLAQWLFDIRFAGEFGVREGINFTTSGRGQLQGGLYAFPVASVIAFAVLTSNAVKGRRPRLALTAVTGLNFVCTLLTYERTFWVATVFGLGFVVLKAGRGPRARAILMGLGIALVVLAVVGTFAPGVLGSARERLLSLGQYSSDGSVRYRVVESGHVLEAIGTHPVLGSGLGAEILWSRPWEQVPVRAYHYTHNGYLWVAWKVGIPAALLLFATLVIPTTWRDSTDDDMLLRAVRHGCQASLLLLLLASLTFPSFNTYGITATMGVMLAFCSVSPLLARSVRRPPSSSPRPAAEGAHVDGCARRSSSAR